MTMFGLKKNGDQPLEITVSNRTVVRVLLLVVITMAGLAVIQQISHALVLIFVAFFLALVFNAPVSWLARHLPKRWRGSRALATTLSLLAVLLLLGAFLASIVPPIARQSTSFIQSAPHLLADIQNQDTTIGDFVARNNLGPQIEKISNELANRLQNASGAAVSTVSQVGSSVFASITVIAMTFMMLLEGPHWMSWVRRLLPSAKKHHADTLTERMYRVIKGYVNGQVLLAFIAALLILPALLLFHVPYPFALMFVVFICGLIPMIGHTIGAIIVTLVALTHSLPSALLILAYYILYQQIENYAVQPRVQANTTNMSPLLVFVAMVIGVNFSGLLGGLVAIPVMACIRVAVLYWLERRDANKTDQSKPRAELA